MNRKLYAIDSITFVFGLALLFAAKGFGNLSAESGYASLKWVLVLFAVVSNIFYYRNTNEAEIAIGNSALPLVFSLVFVGIFFNPLVIFNRFPSAPMTANMLILSGSFVSSAHIISTASVSISITSGCSNPMVIRIQIMSFVALAHY